MGRPPLSRRVSYIPQVTYFKPAGIPLRELEEVNLTVEEIEAIRLKDSEDLEQAECAERMNVSRPTFVRILDSARKKLAEAVIHGKAVRIEGGHFELAARRFRCRNNHEWQVTPADLREEAAATCPDCHTTAVSVNSWEPGPAQTGRRRASGRRRLE